MGVAALAQLLPLTASTNALQNQLSGLSNQADSGNFASFLAERLPSDKEIFADHLAATDLATLSPLAQENIASLPLASGLVSTPHGIPDSPSPVNAEDADRRKPEPLHLGTVWQTIKLSADDTREKSPETAQPAIEDAQELALSRSLGVATDKLPVKKTEKEERIQTEDDPASTSANPHATSTDTRMAGIEYLEQLAKQEYIAPQADQSQKQPAPNEQIISESIARRISLATSDEPPMQRTPSAESNQKTSDLLPTALSEQRIVSTKNNTRSQSLAPDQNTSHSTPDLAWNLSKNGAPPPGSGNSLLMQSKAEENAPITGAFTPMAPSTPGLDIAMQFAPPFNSSSNVAVASSIKQPAPENIEESIAIAERPTLPTSIAKGSPPGLQNLSSHAENSQPQPTNATTAEAANLAAGPNQRNEAGAEFAVTLAAQTKPNESPPLTPQAKTVIDTPLHDQQWGQNLGNHVVWLAKSEQQSAQIHINPPQLGPVQITLNLSGDQASIAFASPHSEVRQAIQDAMPQLREMLSSAGINLGQTNVGSQQPQAGRDFAWQFANENRSGRENAILPAENQAAQSVSGLMIQRGRGLVDLFA